MRFVATIAWGLFCACSWTWCIGMFLPKIMIERWGWWGFIAFAAPNVIGCTAFGYVVKNRARSEAMINRHSRAMLWFSSITLAYHLFFLGWLFESLVAVSPIGYMAPMMIAAIVFALAVVFSFLPTRDWLGLSVLVYAASILAFLNVGAAGIARGAWSGEMNLACLWWVAPLLLFGFSICPYLDLTFHRAIQNSPSRHAFAVFGAAFSVMIVLTVAIWFWPEFLKSNWLPPVVIGHILAQTVFTMGAHMRELRLSPANVGGTARGVAIVLPLMAAPLIYAGRLFSESASVGENLYIGFLVLYGTVLPGWFVVGMLGARKTPGRAEG